MMSHFGNVPAETLIDAVEKHVAKMDEAELSSLLATGVASMPLQARHALVSSIFDAFRERGESSEDAAEGASTALADLENGDEPALRALLRYAQENTGVLKEAMAVFAEEHPTELNALPSSFVEAVAARL
ncbi:MAG TPA: hypothetical protein VFN49_13705 [Candidatus Aquilonibacter sp.]|nr:hypothetical protein [Candidatus Aquilonibacter sp.]